MNFDVFQLLGSGFDYVYLPAGYTRGGILVAWLDTVWTVLLVPFAPSRSLSESGLYGPSCDSEKASFLLELHDLRTMRTGPWVLIGDFNII
jgi:hypothetical protein